jgi:aryl-alcohol dehydrogenase-like predicted oxidoreductase
MRYRRLGVTDLVVSELGFGSYAIGGNNFGNSYGTTDDDVSISALHAALDHGCNLFDTADIYGHGHGEILLGQALRRAGKLNEVIIATKVGHDFYHEPITQNFSPDYISRAVEESLRRLGRDYIDLYQLHNPPLSVIQSANVFDVLERLISSGKIRCYGLSVHTLEEALAAISCAKPSTVQIVYNVFSQLQPHISAEALLPHILKSKVGLIAREPLANGFLAREHGIDESYEAGDIRSEWSRSEREMRVTLFRSFAGMLPYGVTPAQMALRFVLDEPAVSTTIVGIKSPAQAHENFEAVNLPSCGILCGLPAA